MAATTPLTILAIEDHAVTRNLIAGHLQNQNLTILQAADATSGLQLFHQKNPDLLLLDMQLPRDGGLKVLTEVCRQSPATAVIIMSDRRKKNDFLKALHLGAWDYLHKPVNLDLLSDTIHRAGQRLSRLRLQRHTPSSGGDIATKQRQAGMEQQNRTLQIELARATQEVARRNETGTALAEANRTLETIFDNSQTLIAYLDTNCNFVMVNQAYATADNRHPSFFLGKNHFDLYPDPPKESIFRKTVATGEPYFAGAELFTYANHPERGVTFWDWNLIPTRNAAGTVTGLILTLVDVTARTRMEAELSRHHQHLAKLVESRTADLTRTNRELHEKITELEKTREELEKNKSRYHRIIQATSNYIYTVRAENGQPMETIHRPACEAVTGYTSEEFTADPFLWITMVPEEDHALVRHQIERIWQGETPPPIEHRIRRKDGTLRWISNTPVLHCDESGKLLSYEGVVQDITDRKRAEQELQEAYAKLEKRVEERTAKLCRTNASLKREIAERRLVEERLAQAQQKAENASIAKSQFLANMSHEIRTPMNAIIGLTDVALGTALSDEQRRYLKMVKESASALLGLLNDILDFSKIEADQIDLEHHPFDLQQTMEAVVQPLAMRAHQKNLALLCQAPRSLAHQLIGDSHRLRQVLLNLVGNALKFTLQGQILLKADINWQNETAVGLHFTVTDTGLGIAPDKLEDIFDSFTQADASITRVHGGTGLGLAISRRLVHLMGGDIRVESILGKGSTFHFTARFGKGAAKASPALSASVTAAPVLIIDNNPDSLRILRETFLDWGFAVTTADSAAGALQLAALATADGRPAGIIVLDETVVATNGFTIVDLLRAELAPSPPPLLLLTSPFTHGEVSKKCHTIPNCFCLGKPFSHHELREMVIATLTNGILPARHDTAGVPVTPAPRPAPLRVLVVEDNPINSELAQIILEQAGHKVSTAEDGLAALTALANDDFDAVLMDVQMPRLDGLAASRLIRQCEQGKAVATDKACQALLPRLRKRRQGHHLPIVAMTAHALSSDRDRCLEAGMDSYVTKPFAAEQILAVLDDVTADDPSNRPPPLRPLQPLKPAEPKAMADSVKSHLATAHRLTPAQIDHLLTACRDSLATSLQAAEAALTREDIESLTTIAHTLKGVLANLGLNDLAELARRIETGQRRQDEAMPPYAAQLKGLRQGLAPLLGKKVRQKTPPPSIGAGEAGNLDPWLTESAATTNLFK